MRVYYKSHRYILTSFLGLCTTLWGEPEFQLTLKIWTKAKSWGFHFAEYSSTVLEYAPGWLGFHSPLSLLFIPFFVGNVERDQTWVVEICFGSGGGTALELQLGLEKPHHRVP